METKGQTIGTVGILTTIVAMIILIVLVMGYSYIPAGNVGVKNRLGEVSDAPLNPGIYWTGLLTSVIDFSTRVQLRTYDANSASKDLQVVNTKIALNFRIDQTETPKIYKTLGENYQDLIISPIIQEAVKSSTARYTAENLIKERPAVKQDITAYITEKLENQGIIVTEVSIQDFKFSPEFDKAIESKQVAEQKALEAENKYNEMEWTSRSMQLQSEVLEIKKLDLQQQWIERWNGQLPLIVTSDSQGMFMQMDLQQLQSVSAQQNKTN